MKEFEFITPLDLMKEKIGINSQKYLLQGESIEQFTTALKELADTCEFKEKDTLIRDRIVLGIRDFRIQVKLLQCPNLSLSEAENISRSMETQKVIYIHQCQQRLRKRTNKVRVEDAVKERLITEIVHVADNNIYQVDAQLLIDFVVFVKRRDITESVVKILT
ncbi:hypothetical protein Trydic_g5339 [Trypoxylus dichotomus]